MEWGVSPVKDRNEAEHRKKELVYVGMSPYYSIDKAMNSSIPYLIPRAAELLNDIAHNFLDSLPNMNERFEQFLTMLKIFYELSQDQDARTLASTSFADVKADRESRRVAKVKEFISIHYAEDLRLEDLAALVGMTPSAFSRFFKQHTTRTLSDYIIDVRLGNAARLLVDTTTSISEISYACGFNNLSNFNRIFKARRGYTPRDFRALFTKNRVYV